VLGLLTVVALFGLPVWAVLVAGVIQVYPQWVGFDPSAVAFVVGPDGQLQTIDARPSLVHWVRAGALSGAVVALLVVVGGALRWWSTWSETRSAGRAHDRYAAMAGSAVLEGVELKTTSRQGSREGSDTEASEATDPRG
jgi:hypothetical protein